MPTQPVFKRYSIYWFRDETIDLIKTVIPTPATWLDAGLALQLNICVKRLKI